MRTTVQGGLGILALALAGIAAPIMAAAEPVLIRVEARRGPDAGAAAQRWTTAHPEVVTFPLPGGWTGIALGPMERDAANDLMAQLKADRRIPQDSFIAPPAEGAVLRAAQPKARPSRVQPPPPRRRTLPPNPLPNALPNLPPSRLPRRSPPPVTSSASAPIASGRRPTPPSPHGARPFPKPASRSFRTTVSP